ncbi:hypothetical protein [Paenibacillus lautus]|uniref:hypothetical protein n=1 Tax=Paenibacillus lautus TaxID=1401 RepID=UPI002DBB43BD|nr:hypothetical protein [Paenibacillus lautus]MEC0257843.1 hypothetical protein [Paenibacillus lautus]
MPQTTQAHRELYAQGVVRTGSSATLYSQQRAQGAVPTGTGSSALGAQALDQLRADHDSVICKQRC